ncbi:S41 family peptidase, partial [Bacteroidota bacterium]
LGNSNSIILDLRFNHGGNKNMVQFISSYFFKEKKQTNSLYFREADSLVTGWTFADVPGKKLLDQKVYILTGKSTASGAESFAYTMKNYKRAVIIGENTAGAAHWTECYKYPRLDIFLNIPVARPINPVTKKGWERVGVIPDIEIPENKALDVAYITALKDIEQECTNKKEKENLLWFIRLTELKHGTSINKNNDLTEYTGQYSNGRLSFIYKDEKLFWKDADNEYVLMPLSNDAFVFDDTENYILQFLRNEENKIYAMQYFNKNSKENPVYKKTGSK